MANELHIHEAFKNGDLSALKLALGDPPDFPNCCGPLGIGVVLEYAIYHSPLAFIQTLLELGANPNYEDHAGFPSLIAALSCPERSDRPELLKLLLTFGADIQQRGVNDYTPLHYAAAGNDVPMIEFLLAHGANPDAKTRVDDYATPLEEAQLLGQKEAVARLTPKDERK
ncbi:ankyrin repeat domain-containing protein [Candidatus Nitronereus thalassa]|uniref:Ankyrin repeat domain-containing protein n=1 Tax=Candidatus Nitronereus thalassa TaxID=3020898 RepID=A0ABU3KB02_9BACT|nr:ankyrin repeat domain-containing protein [Candidatus Nitronereus thalassa]MDT7043590.1 ankyrin repeat domain-containing protein [Candidatus Nitronereus thalassa]